MIFALHSGTASSMALSRPSSVVDIKTNFLGAGRFTLDCALVEDDIEVANVEMDSSILASLASISVGIAIGGVRFAG